LKLRFNNEGKNSTLFHNCGIGYKSLNK